MVARQQNDIIISDVDKNLQGPKIYLCARSGCSTDCVEGIQRQTEVSFVTVRVDELTSLFFL